MALVNKRHIHESYLSHRKKGGSLQYTLFPATPKGEVFNHHFFPQFTGLGKVHHYPESRLQVWDLHRKMRP